MEDRGASLKDLVAILYRPRQTFRRILDSGGDRWTIQIVVLASVCASASDSDIRVLLQRIPAFPLHAALALVALGLLLIAAMRVVLLYAAAGIATVVGRLLDGHGAAGDVRAALAWGVVPAIWSVAFRIPSALYLSTLDLQIGDERQMFFDLVMQGALTFAVVLGTLQLLFDVWILFVASNTVGEALRFSSWKGLATLAITIVLPIALIVGAVVAFR